MSCVYPEHKQLKGYINGIYEKENNMEGNNNIEDSLQEKQIKQEGLLLFCSMAFMVAGPVFWFMAGVALDVWALSLEPETVDILEWVSIAISLVLSLCGAALCVAGWLLSAWHAWLALRSTRPPH